MSEHGSRPDCPICEATGARPFAEENGHALHKCRGCAAVFVHPQPTPDELRALYEARASSGDESDYYGGYLENEVGLRRHAREILDRIGPPRAGGAKLLEVGCGPGFFLDEARQRGWEAHGIEPNRVHAQHARDKYDLDVQPATLESAELPDAGYDLIVQLDLMSHLHDPIGAMQKLVRALDADGQLVIQGGLKAENEAKPEHEDWETPFHLFHFSMAAFAKIFQRVGLTLEDEHIEAKLTLPKVASSPRLRVLRQLAGPFVKRVLKRLPRTQPPTDHTVILIARPQSVEAASAAPTPTL